MNDAIKLIGIVIVVIGFVMKFDTLATVVVAGLVTGLISGMSIMDILNTLGTAFLTNRTATLFIFKSCFAPCWYFCLFMIQYA